jgi:hypothetical protein
VEGVFYSLEMHAVHQADDLSLLVVGILLDYGLEQSSKGGAAFFNRFRGKVECADSSDDVD